MSKLFIYSDYDSDASCENVFLSTRYKDLKEFKKENPDLRPLVSYNVKDVIGVDIDELEQELLQAKKDVEFWKEEYVSHSETMCKCQQELQKTREQLEEKDKEIEEYRLNAIGKMNLEIAHENSELREQLEKAEKVVGADIGYNVFEFYRSREECLKDKENKDEK